MNGTKLVSWIYNSPQQGHLELPKYSHIPKVQKLDFPQIFCRFLNEVYISTTRYIFPIKFFPKIARNIDIFPHTMAIDPVPKEMQLS